MPTSPNESGAGASTLLVFADESGALGRWLLLDSAGMLGEGHAADGLPAAPFRTVLAVPGEQVALHWIELAAGLAPAQAVAAARLMLADASAEPMATLHAAVGRPEQGLTPVGLVPAARVAGWLAAASAAGLDPDSIVPAPLLLAPPEQGFARLGRGAVADYRGIAAAFTLEPELAARITADEPVTDVDEPGFRSALPGVLAPPVLDLRQGAFARRRQWRLETGRLRRVAMLVLGLVLISLVVQIATILSYTFAADRIQAEADALSAAQPGGAAARPEFGAAAAVLFDAVRATPNVEIARIDYRSDGSLGVTVTMDSPATVDALRSRIEASGLTVVPGQARTSGGRSSADLILRTA